jgi:hypothetical protein
MKQVSLAGCLYFENQEQFPLFASELVESKLIPKELCKLRTDRFPNGIANHFVKEMSGLSYLLKSLPSYPLSFISFGDLGNPRSRLDAYLSKPNAGWAFTAIEPRPRLKGTEFWGAHYFRIHIDGSVQRHPVRIRQGPSIAFDDFFFDSE